MVGSCGAAPVSPSPRPLRDRRESQAAVAVIAPTTRFCAPGHNNYGVPHPIQINKADLGYSLNRSCPAQRVGLGRSDLAELNQRPGPMTFSYRSCSTYVNSPEADIACSTTAELSPLVTRRLPGLGRRPEPLRRRISKVPV